LATGFGFGYVPVASGTVGSLMGILIYLFLNSFSSFWANVLFLGCLFITGVYVSGLTERVLHETDARVIVIDEIYGMVLTLLLIPKATYLVAAFFLFRLFDILKPFPVGMVERKMRGGLAIMLDDVVAAGYTVLILQVFNLVIR
jgi:phosphatidylglycerophosphatase A